MNEDELEKIDIYILEIASKISPHKRIIEIEELYKTSISQLLYSKDEIMQSIKKLYLKKYLIEGFRLTKDTLLNNEKRKQIFNYVKKNPGTHNREIREALNLGAYSVYRNLKYLEEFGFIRSKKFMNKVTYFLLDTDESKDKLIIVLKNERRKIIFEIISNFEKVQLNELEKTLNLEHGNIQPHLKILLEYNLIDVINENNIIYYVPKIEVTNK